MNTIQQLVDNLAERLRHPVGVDDRRFRALAYSSHDEEIDVVRRDSILGRRAPQAVTLWLEDLGVLTAERCLRVPANPELGMVARMCFPLRFRGRLLGFLWLAEGDKCFDNAALSVCDSFAHELAEELYRQQQQESDTRRREAETARRLVSDPPLVGRSDVAFAIEPHYGVLVLRTCPPAGRPPPAATDVRLTEAIDRVGRQVQRHHQLADVAANEAVVLLAFDAADQLEHHGEALLSAARRELADIPGVDVVAGIGAPVDTIDKLPIAYEQARLAVRLGGSVRSLPPLVRWSRLGVLRLLGELLGDRDPQALIPAPILRLLEAPDGAALVETLASYLDHADDAAAAAADLFLHRSSLYKRLHRIERLAEVDLHSGSDRLELHLGVWLWRLSGISPPETAPDASPESGEI